MKITVEADQMQRAGGEIRTGLSDLRANMNAIESLVLSTAGEWQGNAGQAYQSRILYVRHEFREVENFFEEMASLMDQFAEEYERHEDELAALIKAV